MLHNIGALTQLGTIRALMKSYIYCENFNIHIFMDMYVCTYIYILETIYYLFVCISME